MSPSPPPPQHKPPEGEPGEGMGYLVGVPLPRAAGSPSSGSGPCSPLLPRASAGSGRARNQICWAWFGFTSLLLRPEYSAEEWGLKGHSGVSRGSWWSGLTPEQASKSVLRPARARCGTRRARSWAARLRKLAQPHWATYSCLSFLISFPSD